MCHVHECHIRAELTPGELEMKEAMQLEPKHKSRMASEFPAMHHHQISSYEDHHVYPVSWFTAVNLSVIPSSMYTMSITELSVIHIPNDEVDYKVRKRRELKR